MTEPRSRRQVPASTAWVAAVGYSRAVRVGQHVYVSGTTAGAEGAPRPDSGDLYAQTITVLRNIEAALRELDCPITAVVRTRMFLVDINDWEKAARAHHEFFGEILPASSMVEVSRLLRPDLLIEIEADALITDPNPTIQHQ